MLGYGMDVVTARKHQSFALGQFSASATSTANVAFCVPPGGPDVRIIGIHFAGDAAPTDGDGDVLIDARVRDASEGAFDVIVNDFDADTINTAWEWTEATLVADGSEELRTLEPGDSIQFQLINDSAGIDTNANMFACVEYFYIPRDQSDEDEPSYLGYPSQATDF